MATNTSLASSKVHSHVVTTTTTSPTPKCGFMTAACNGTLRTNVTTLMLDRSCVTYVINAAAPTPSPFRQFEINLFKAAIHGIDDRLAIARHSNHSIDEIKKIFAKQDHAHKAYVRSDTCWAHTLDLTPISPWNSAGHTRKAGVLISPRHALWARHYSIKVNNTLRFVDNNNNVVDRTVTEIRTVPNSGHPYLHGYDIAIGVLDRDVPDTITFAKVMARNLTSIRPGHTRIPAFDTDFEEKALVADLNFENGNMVGLRAPPTTSYRHQLYEPKIVGDSGNPVFLVIDDQLVLLFVFTYGGAGSGTSVTYHYDAINQLMTRLGGGYQLTEVDLTGYLGSLGEIPSIVG